MLLRLDYGFDCVAQPKLTYEEFIQFKGLRDNAHEAVGRQTEELMHAMKTAGGGSFSFMIGSPLADCHAT